MTATQPTCPHCGNDLTPGGRALGCGPFGSSVVIELPAYCADRPCRRDRDDAAVEAAIARGVIDP